MALVYLHQPTQAAVLAATTKVVQANALKAPFGNNNVTVQVFNAAGALLSTCVFEPFTVLVAGNSVTLSSGARASRNHATDGVPSYAIFRTSTGLDVFRVTVRVANQANAAEELSLDANVIAASLERPVNVSFATNPALPTGSQTNGIATVTSPTASEGSNLIFTVALINQTASVTDVTLSLTPGTAQPGVDYTNGVEYSTNGGQTWQAASGGLASIPTTTSSFLARVATIQDTVVETNETFSLTASLSGVSATGIGTIVDDDTLNTSDVLSREDAVRLAEQATWGANETTVASMVNLGLTGWLNAQFNTPAGQYLGLDYSTPDSTQGNWVAHRATFPEGSLVRENYPWLYLSPKAFQSDLFRQAVVGADQLRQRVGWALSQIHSAKPPADGANDSAQRYAIAHHHQGWRDNAFGNWRTIAYTGLRCPVIGVMLGNVNNNRDNPNENDAREILQLKNLGSVLTGMDGQPLNGVASPTYSFGQMRQYAYALTAYAFREGGVWFYGPQVNQNPPYFVPPMALLQVRYNTGEHALLGGVVIPANATALQAENSVLDSLLAHPNNAPFVSKRLILSLVKSNPSPAYVQRVAQAFVNGVYNFNRGTAQNPDIVSFGSGNKGDMKAVIAAILCDSEARGNTASKSGTSEGRLKEPLQVAVAYIRLFEGSTYSDGNWYVTWPFYGQVMGQNPARPESVFNYATWEFPVPEANNINGQYFQRLDLNATLTRYNLANFLMFERIGNGSSTGEPPEFPNGAQYGAIGARIDFSAWRTLANTPATLVDKMAELLTANRLSGASKAAVLAHVTTLPATTNEERDARTREAFMGVATSQQFHVQR
jgi:uncharacterized protein (DUF1800 family)